MRDTAFIIALGLAGLVILIMAYLLLRKKKRPASSSRNQSPDIRRPTRGQDSGTPQGAHVARLITTRGIIELALNTAEAKRVVQRFVFLAKRGCYNNVPFRRVIPGYMAETACPNGKNLAGAPLRLRGKTGLSHERAGTASLMMDPQDPAENEALIITYVPTPHLDGRCAPFGTVVRGMDVLEALTPSSPADQSASTGDAIRRIEIVER